MGSLSLKDGVWEVAADPHVTMVMKRMFPRLKPHERGTMRLKHSETVARDLVWFLTRHALDMTEHDRFVLTSAADRHRAREVQVKAILSGKVDPRAFPLALLPWVTDTGAIGWAGWALVGTTLRGFVLDGPDAGLVKWDLTARLDRLLLALESGSEAGVEYVRAAERGDRSEGEARAIARGMLARLPKS